MVPVAGTGRGCVSRIVRSSGYDVDGPRCAARTEFVGAHAQVRCVGKGFVVASPFKSGFLVLLG